MLEKIKRLTFDEALNSLRSLQFDVREAPQVAGSGAGQMWVAKYGCAAVLARSAEKGIAVSAGPGLVLGGEIARLVDRGFQKFLKASRIEVPATADRLRAVHRFTEELKEATGAISLYNESLGTVSDRYLYDRIRDRDLPEAARPHRPWELPAR